MHDASLHPHNSSDHTPAPLDDSRSAENDALRRLSRSPQPYLHGQAELLSASRAAPSLSSSAVVQTPLQSDLDDNRSNHKKGRKRRERYSESPSASGTEADDEGYGFIKALPPPPVRPRKGLRDARGEEGVSPSPVTPDAKEVRGYFVDRSGKSWTTDARDKFTKRRRAEVIRRITEVVLLICVGALGLLKKEAWRIVWTRHRAEIWSFVAVLTLLYLMYPLRLLRNIRSRQRSDMRGALALIRIPSSFEPAPLLYPTLLPIVVTISLLPACEQAVLPNLVLGLASLPPALIPLHHSGDGYSLAHWVLSTVPLTPASNTAWSAGGIARAASIVRVSSEELHPETLATLFALHQALLVTLRYVTTTSLLPAELQLLSISLINLLLFAESPQANILRGALWVGGLGLFILCGHVLRWSVALARIPKWRLRRAGRLASMRETFLSSLRQATKKGRSLSFGDSKANPDSDADEDGLIHFRHSQRRPDLKQDPVAHARTNSSCGADIPAARQALHLKNGGLSTKANGRIALSRRRSHTLPTLENLQPPAEPKPQRQRRTKQSTTQAFLALTPAQAALRKWIYAGYAYAAILFLVLIPLRIYVAQYALEGHEPFGWALGYLFSDYAPFRELVDRWGLEPWIPLGRKTIGVCPPRRPARAEYLRRVVFGVTNTRLILLSYYLGTIAVGIAIVLRLSSAVEVDTRRKVFHGMMVAMLLPTIPVDPAYIALALGLVLAVFLLLDLLRAAQVPPLSKPLASFLTPYVDGRDLRGPVVVSHIFLLVGCAIPLWLSLAGTERLVGDAPWRGWEVPSRDVSMVAGVVCVGMGDAAASLVGRRIGRRKWLWPGGKSIEGSLAFALAVTAGLLFGKAWLRLGQWTEADVIADAAHDAAGVAASDGQGSGPGGVGGWTTTVLKATVSACGASLMEAVLTGGNDNVVVPVVLWLLVRGTGL